MIASHAQTIQGMGIYRYFKGGVMSHSPIGHILLVAGLLAVGGCANTLTSHVPSEYRNRQTEIESIAVTGPGASMAMPAFDEFGYNIVDIGFGNDDPLETAKKLGVPYVAVVDSVDSEGSWWDGFFAFSMRITETIKRKIIWSAQGNFGQGGVFINQAKSTTDAMRAMVRDFSESFPPKR